MEGSPRAWLARTANGMARELLYPPGSMPVDFTLPAGEPALSSPDSIA